jgi:hypothetical protein
VIRTNNDGQKVDEPGGSSVTQYRHNTRIIDSDRYENNSESNDVILRLMRNMWLQEQTRSTENQIHPSI